MRTVALILAGALALSGCGVVTRRHMAASVKAESGLELCSSALAQLYAIAHNTTFQPYIYARHLLVLGSQESAAALKRIINELGRLGNPPPMMIHVFANVAQGFERMAARAHEDHHDSEPVSRAIYNSYEVLVHKADNVCRRDAST